MLNKIPGQNSHSNPKYNFVPGSHTDKLSPIAMLQLFQNNVPSLENEPHMCDGFRVPAASPPGRLAMVVKPYRAWILMLCSITLG